MAYVCMTNQKEGLYLKALTTMQLVQLPIGNQFMTLLKYLLLFTGLGMGKIDIGLMSQFF